MAAGFVCYSAAAGGCRLSLPDKLRWGSGGAVGGADGHLLPRILSAGYALFESLPQPRRQRRPIIRREFCGFEEPSRSNLWRLGSCAIRRQQVGAGSACQTNFGGGLGERSAGPTATCCRASSRQAIRYSRPSPSQHESAAPTHNPQESLRIRRPRPLQLMAANGRRQNPRQQPEPGPARRKQVAVGTADRPGIFAWGSDSSLTAPKSTGKIEAENYH